MKKQESRAGNRPLRPLRTRFPLFPSVLILVIALLTSCVTSGDERGTDENHEQPTSPPLQSGAPPSPSRNPIVGSTTTTSTAAGDSMRIDIHGLNRQKNTAVVLELSIRNLGSEEAGIPNPPREGEGSADFQPFFLIDGKNRKKHLPMLYANGECYCSNWEKLELDGGETLSAWVAFPAPPDKVDSMIFGSAIAPPILDIPVKQRTARSEHSATSDLAPSKIWNLRSIENELADGTVREETGDEVSISLSTDVLFDLNEATLSTTAREKLKQVANEIDDASDSSIKIDGHTDSSGTDSINNPLSHERASAVEESLASLVSRSNVEFEVEGHGSDQPIATNETKEGRKKNRRVTITFAR
ncbi:OmpA family protein [Streptomonospora litoralis]|uniref:Outer membrane protein Omp38 n=1 Tax=Streptomonospora litoralis TaxID=2498135 RepID=A0A4P6PYD0_9ACTN|nr:OmpA family protein [Streptomonospora litoralis]QBI53165.1 Outer membrane protein Omp38 precursor [Streptomonospora litoralis]